MSRILSSLFLLLFGINHLAGQLVISNELELNPVDQIHTLWTQRGDQLLGTLQAIKDDSLYFQLEQLEQVLVYHRQEVRYVGLAGEPFPIFSNATTRYRDPRGEGFSFPRHGLLYSTSALVPENQGSYRNNMLLVNEAEFHLGDHFSAGIGAFIPPLVIFRATTRMSLSSFVHLGINANHYMATYDRESFTHPYAILTLGDQDKYLNFTYGYWFQRGYYYDQSKPFPMMSIGGSYTFSKSWRIYFEGLLYNDNYDTYFLPTGYFNYLRRRSVYGFGLWGLPEDAGIPILPWLSYSYLF